MATARPGSSAAASGSAAAADSAFIAADTGSRRRGGGDPQYSQIYFGAAVTVIPVPDVFPVPLFFFVFFPERGRRRRPPRPAGFARRLSSFFLPHSGHVGYGTPRASSRVPEPIEIFVANHHRRVLVHPRRRTSRRPRLPSSRPLLRRLYPRHSFVVVLILIALSCCCCCCESPRRRRLVGRPRWSRTSSFPRYRVYVRYKKEVFSNRALALL